METEVADQSVPPPTPGAQRHEVSHTDEDPAPPESTIDEVDRLLDEVEAALARLDDGTYGSCASCGKAIDDARLSDQPTARTCAACDSPASDVRPADPPASELDPPGAPPSGPSPVSGGPGD